MLQVAYLRQRICNAVTDCQHLHHSLAPNLAIWRQTMIYKPKNCVPAINHHERGNAHREKRNSLTLQPLTMLWPQWFGAHLSHISPTVLGGQIQRPLTGSQLLPKCEHSQASQETEKNKTEEKLSLYVTPGEQTLKGLDHSFTVQWTLSYLWTWWGRQGRENLEKPKLVAVKHRLTALEEAAMGIEWEK